MIKRITNPEEFKRMIDDIDELFYEENKTQGHAIDLIQDKESIKNALGNAKLLSFDVIVFANENEHKKFDAVGIFLKDKNYKFGVNFLNEFLWVSKEPRSGFKIFKKAVALARKMDIKYVALSTSAKNPNTPKYEKFYKKLGFIKDSTVFIAKL